MSDGDSPANRVALFPGYARRIRRRYRQLLYGSLALLPAMFMAGGGISAILLVPLHPGAIVQIALIGLGLLALCWGAARLVDRHILGRLFRESACIELSEARLRRERQAAARRDTARATVLALAGHEVRTPLHGALGSLELLACAPLPRAQREAVAAAHRALTSLARYIGDLFDIAAIESGKFRLVDVPFNPTALVEEIALTHAPGFHRKGLQFRCLADPGLPVRVRGDAGRLRQILDNLLSNALKFTSSGEILLRAFPAATSPDVYRIVFQVEDSGIGIAPQHQQHLFAPFAQAHENIAAAYGGTGLGLSLCRHLCERMGGTIALDSQTGRGSRFTVNIPFPVAHSGTTTGCDVMPPASPLAPAENSPPRVASGCTSERILVAEDDGVGRELLRRQLAQLGWEQVHVVDNGDDALRLCAAHTYDIFLMDWRLPGAAGPALAARVRARQPGIRIIAITADMAFPANGEEAIVDEVLYKPVSLPQLSRVLDPPASLPRSVDAPDGACANGTTARLDDPDTSVVLRFSSNQASGWRE